MEAGRARLFADLVTAEKWLGQKVWPAPLGNIAKWRPDGSVKHRPIQDQRRNCVSKLVILPECQLLPRPLDHAHDLAMLVAEAMPGQQVWTLILDLVDAFLGDSIVSG